MSMRHNQSHINGLHYPPQHLVTPNTYPYTFQIHSNVSLSQDRQPNQIVILSAKTNNLNLQSTKTTQTIREALKKVNQILKIVFRMFHSVKTPTPKSSHRCCVFHLARIASYLSDTAFFAISMYVA